LPIYCTKREYCRKLYSSRSEKEAALSAHHRSIRGRRPHRPLSVGGLDASAFKDTAFAPKDADDRIIYNSDTGALCYDADGWGTAFGNVRFATITGSPVLTAADFVVV
jgi:hypothetical protein